MEELFVFETELEIFKQCHPEYNVYEEQYDKYGDLVGYIAKIEEDND